MRVYRAKDYKDMSRKAANIISAQIDFETKQCAWTGNWLYANRNLQSAGRLVQKRRLGFFRGDKCQSGRI